MSTDLKFVELTPDVLKIYTPEYMYLNIRMTAYQFGTVGWSPTEFFFLFGVGVGDFNSRMLY